jgi:fructokinase
MGCLETYLSGAGLARDYRARTGRECAAQSISAAAGSGDGQARASIGMYKDRLARGLAAVVNLIDPDIIVVGGGLSNISALYDDLPGLMARYAFSDALDTAVVRALHGDSSGVRGAARLHAGAPHL